MNEKATLAAGCFWGVEKLFKELQGVLETSVGYIGGVTDDPDYKSVCSGVTGHFEAIEIIFDPSMIHYKDLLKYFFKLHDPTQTDGQHNDIGPQYRSAIFYHTNSQRDIAENLIKTIDKENIFSHKIATKVLEATKYFIAEDYHQNYLDKNPNGYMCHFITPSPKIDDL